MDKSKLIILTAAVLGALASLICVIIKAVRSDLSGAMIFGGCLLLCVSAASAAIKSMKKNK